MIEIQPGVITLTAYEKPIAKPVGTEYSLKMTLDLP